MKIAFLTLGCKVNAYETECMKSRFAEAGYHIVSFSEQADIYLVNTCTVTNIADRKSRKMLHRARKMNPDAVVAAAGCYADSAGEWGETDPAVDVYISNQEKERVVELVEAALHGPFPERRETPGISEAAQAEKHTRAYIQVQNGCNQYCSYCIIPYVRGPLASKSTEQVLGEVRQLAGQGIHEIVVTGIHLSSYGADGGDAREFIRMQGKPLLELLREIADIEGIDRIRLGSLEPRIITEEFARSLAENTKVCPHFHLSLQSGCDAVLQRMNRHYTTAEYQEKVELLRDIFVHPAITTDIIVGFPQETEEEYERTRAYAEQIGFAQIHVFKYSRRRGTVADGMDGQVSEQEKAVRSDRLLQTQRKLERQYQQLFVGSRQAVLFEEVVRSDGVPYLTGYSEYYVRIAVAAEHSKEAQKLCNTIQMVHVTGWTENGILCGELCKI